jgi:hypothetical protein
VRERIRSHTNTVERESSISLRQFAAYEYTTTATMGHLMNQVHAQFAYNKLASSAIVPKGSCDRPLRTINRPAKQMYVLFSLFASLSVDKILGVSPANAGQYRRAISVRKNTFTCFDKSKTIPMARVNDGYCDCADGSDEPGTNACGIGDFYCRNTGSVPLLIPKWMVNDGVCDCCDGSDEIGNPHANCDDACGQIRRRSIQFRANLTNMTMEGGKLRGRYSERGRLELSVRRKQLQMVDAQKKKVLRASDLVEKIYWANRMSEDSSTMMTQLDLVMSELNADFENVDKIERNIRKGSRKLKEEVPHYGRFNLKHRTEWHFNVENAICYLPDFSYIFDRLKSAYDICREFLTAFHRQSEPDHSTSAFNKLSAINGKIENSTIKIENTMSLDFGPDKEFLPLYRHWYYFQKDDYYIEFYPFHNCTRSPRRSWGDRNGQFLVGLYNKSEPFKWVFSEGAHCGARMPPTGMEVRLHCSLKDEILSFREYSKCQFRMDFGTPGACVDEYKRRVDSMDDVTLDDWARDAGLYR